MAFQPRSELRLERQWNAIGTRSTRDRNAIFVRLFLSSTVVAVHGQHLYLNPPIGRLLSVFTHDHSITLLESYSQQADRVTLGFPRVTLLLLM